MVGLSDNLTEEASMSRIASRLDTSSPDYVANSDALQRQVADLQTHIAAARRGGPESAAARHRERGRMLVRERIAALIDPGSDFLEFSPLAGHGLHDGAVPAGGIVTGVGRVSGRETVVVANDPTVKGGTYYPITVKKHLRAQEVAQQNGLPCVYLVESGGAFLPAQDEVFPDREHFGRIFYNQALLSASGIPQFAVVHGNCTAGGAYVPAMSDQNVIVRGQGQVFLGGPPLVKAATGEETDAESLGGALVHTRHSGVCDYAADNDFEALAQIRRLMARTPQRLVAPDAGADGGGRPPQYDPAEIYGAVSANLQRPYDVREVIARLVDDSDFDEFKPAYGATLVCGYARWCGHEVGILANNGILFSESALKAVQFIQLCARDGLPLLFLQNIVGFMVGRRAESQGIAKDGAKMVTAVACAEVPKFTVIVGGSYGAGNYAMCGRAFGPRLLLQWPNARTSVMGGEQAARVLASLRSEQLQREGRPWTEQDEQAFCDPIRAQYETQGHPYYASARLWDDGVIDPLDTRRMLGRSLAFARAAPSAVVPRQRWPFGVFRT
jgi:3-methylcrotonyl-CoA carboxylase beta subunit